MVLSMRKKISTIDIHDAALKVFAEFGYKKATMEDIAKELNMTKCNLYLYAANKMDLYQNTVREAIIKWQLHVLEALLTKKTAVDQFFTLGTMAIRYLDEVHDLRTLLKRDPQIFPMFPTNEPYETIHNDSVKMLQDIIERGIAEKIFRPVNVENISRILFSLYKMFIIRIYVQDSGDKSVIKALFNEALDLVTRGLFASPPQEGNGPVKLINTA